MKISQQGLDLIKHFEGLRLQPYYCSGGVLTIGYGHTKSVRKGMSITEHEAEQLLKQDLAWAEDAVSQHVQVPIKQNQFDALVSFVFNLGEGAFQRSTLLRKLNAADYKGAANEFKKWVHAGGKRLTGLVRRREAERELFLSQIADMNTPKAPKSHNPPDEPPASPLAMLAMLLRSLFK